MFYFNKHTSILESKMIKKILIKFLIISYEMDTLAYDWFNVNKK